MKKFVSVFGMAALMVAFGSCVEKSEKYQNLLAERDSLMVVSANVNTDFESSLATINEIEMALQRVREAENIIILENEEGNTNYAVTQIEALENTIRQNKEKIADLENQLNQAGSKSKQLTATINRLKGELDEKDSYITSLKSELQQSKAQVVELTGQVEDLNKNVADLSENIESLNAQKAEQQATIRLQETALNTVFYAVAPLQTLKENGIVTKGGLFKKEEMDLGASKELFSTADKRTLKTLPLNTKKATIMTNHPESSYTLTKGEDDMLTLEIVDQQAFWNISNYLIISIK